MKMFHWRRGSIYWLDRLLTIVVLSAIAGCSNGISPATPELKQAVVPFGDLLPSLPSPGQTAVPKQVLAAQPTQIDGSASFSQSGGATAVGTGMNLPSAVSSIQWAIYHLNSGGNPLLSMSVDYSPSGGLSTWVGLANFNAGIWEFTGTYPVSGPVINLSSGDYLSQTSDFFCVIVTFNGTSSTINSVTVTVDAPAQTFGISGSITEGGGSPLANVQVTLQPGGLVVQSGVDGSYSFTGLAPGAYTITPSLTGYTFTPASSPVTITSADETGVDFSGEPDAPSVTYTNDIKAILDSRCVVCHNNSSPVGRPRLHDYASASANASKALKAVNDNAMPPGSPLTAQQKALFQAWVDAGTPE